MPGLCQSAHLVPMTSQPPYLMAPLPTVDYPPDTEIDADLEMAGFDPTVTYPEYGHKSLREAYTAGFETAAFRAIPDVALTLADLADLPARTVLLCADGTVREVLHSRSFPTLLRDFGGTELLTEAPLTRRLPATVIFRPAT